MKRRNRFTLNFLSPNFTGRKKKYKISKEVIYSQHSAKTAKDIPENYLDEDNFSMNDELPDMATTAHMKRKLRLAEKWMEIRENAYTVMINRHALQKEIECFACSSIATTRCTLCGPHLMCLECCYITHNMHNFHHCPEVWKDNCFVPLELPLMDFPITTHTCETVHNQLVTCFHIEGVPRQLNISFCKCKNDSLRIMELGYWPASPSRPVLAFSFSFFDWLEALLLECQIALNDYCDAVEFLLKDKMKSLPCKIYPVLIDCFEEYRLCKGKLRDLKDISFDRSSAKCPACPKTGIVTISIDANFGLCRRRAAGNSVHPPIAATKLFFDQDEVDQFVTQYDSQADTNYNNQECSNFVAGNALRSNNRFSALKETGIMGAVCRHEFPLCFVNLCHGESVYLLEKLKQMYPNHNIQLMYDIACVLVKHLKANKRNDLLKNVTFAVPVFHAYGHILQCQNERNPRNMTAFGLSDGEGVERLWAYLRNFSAMTKEMQPSHRIDILTDVLLHYRRKTSEKIGHLLCKRMDHAKELHSDALKGLTALKDDPSNSITDVDIEQWVLEAKECTSHHSSPQDLPATWQEDYVCLIDAANIIRNALMNCTDVLSDNVRLLLSHLIKIEQKLQLTESNHGVASRWLITSQEYKDTIATSKSKEKQKLRIKMQKEARERWFLLRLKSKYADGQKIAVRLSHRINVVSKQLKNSLSKYNSDLNRMSQLTWEEVTDLTNSIYNGCIFTTTEVPIAIKAKAVQLYHQVNRAQEEILRLKEEMSCCVQHYITKYQLLCDRIEVLEHSEQNDNLHTVACISLLKLSTSKCYLELNSLTCFLQYTSLPELERILQEIELEKFCLNCVDSENHSFEDTNDCDVYLRVPDSIQCSSEEYSENEDEAVHTGSNSYLLFEHDNQFESSDFSSSVGSSMSLSMATVSTSNSGPVGSNRSSLATVSTSNSGPVGSNRSSLATVSPSISGPANTGYSIGRNQKHFSAYCRVGSPTASESESDEEMEVQNWRVDRFNKECYLQTLRDQATISEDEFLSEKDKEILKMIKQGKDVLYDHTPRSYLKKH